MTCRTLLGSSVLIVLIFASLLPVSLRAQQVASIDLTQIEARVALRSPPLPPGTPERHSGANETHGCSESGTIVGALRTTLLSMDRAQYRVGDAVTFEVKVENIGSQPLQIPLSPHLADLQPEDPSKKFGYLELTIALWIGGHSWKTNHANGTTLYGSEARPDTMQTLQPGEWVRIVAKGSFDSLKTDRRLTQHQLDDPVDHANARTSIFRTETLLAPTTSASVSHAICMISRQGPDVPVTVSEAHK